MAFVSTLKDVLGNMTSDLGEEPYERLLKATNLSGDSKLTMDNIIKILLFVSSLARDNARVSVERKIEIATHELSTFLDIQSNVLTGIQQNLVLVHQAVEKDKELQIKLEEERKRTYPGRGTLGKKIKTMFNEAKFLINGEYMAMNPNYPEPFLEKWFVEHFKPTDPLEDQLKKMKDIYLVYVAETSRGASA